MEYFVAVCSIPPSSHCGSPRKPRNITMEVGGSSNEQRCSSSSSPHSSRRSSTSSHVLSTRVPSPSPWTRTRSCSHCAQDGEGHGQSSASGCINQRAVCSRHYGGRNGFDHSTPSTFSTMDGFSSGRSTCQKSGYASCDQPNAVRSPSPSRSRQQTRDTFQIECVRRRRLRVCSAEKMAPCSSYNRTRAPPVGEIVFEASELACEVNRRTARLFRPRRHPPNIFRIQYFPGPSDIPYDYQSPPY